MFYRILGETLKWGIFFFNQNPSKKLTKTHTKPTRKIKHKNKHYKKKKINFFFFMNPYLIDTPISNNIHKKICQKTYKNPQKKTHTPF
jgi:hypothetical protein